ncbi:MAG: hypothetical protein ACRD20_15570 [Terriglobales bacterium]
MRVLLLHPEDQIPAARRGGGWDLVVDLGRAPVSTYESWGKQAGCRVISLHDFARDREDLQRVRELFQLGFGQMVDAQGIDWWDVLSLLFESNLRQLMLIGRLARELKGGCELHASRSSSLATALQILTKTSPVRIEAGFRPLQWARHYRAFFTQLDGAQISQIFQDKLDREHRLRRRLIRHRRVAGDPVVLLPSAYINVSRTAVSYAALLPREKFFLVYARNSARLRKTPSNVSTAPLDPYFVPADPVEARALSRAWELLEARLIAGAEEYSAAKATGVLDGIPGSMRWGIALRDAWIQVFESEAIVGCLCADDSNPYTRLPLILARNRGIPTLACHHGALDSKMAVKTAHADVYLAKGEIERDYLVRSCGVAAERIVLGGQGLPSATDSTKATVRSNEPWLVFFTEPYQAAGWRADEVYRDLLPELWSLAQTCGLKLVFKIHPFESVRGHRRILRKYLPRQEARIGVIAGAPSPHLWRNTRFALTVQSTVALQCTSLGIPVFLCSWLQDSTSGYVEQFARFGIGHILKSADELNEVPRLLAINSKNIQIRPTLWETMDPAKLRDLLLRAPLPEAIQAQA